MEKLGTLSVDERFCGPPGTGNGGYVCGRLANYLSPRVTDAEAVQVRLQAPVPLECSLDIWLTENGSLQLKQEEKVLATAVIRPLTVELPPCPPFSVAVEAAKHCRGLTFHPFPECFVCGPDRLVGDGLRILPGPISRTDMQPEPDDGFDSIVTAPWRPDQSLAPVMTGLNQGTVISPEFIWAALDCTGSFSIDFSADKVLVLGQFTVRLLSAVQVGEPCVVLGWLTRVEGRKHCADTAIYNAKQKICGLGEAIWIQI